MIAKVQSLLEQLNGALNVDADTYDYDFIAALPITPHDATSNQGFIHQAITDARNRDTVDAAVAEFGAQGWEVVYAHCVARIAAKVTPLISGRVLAQTSPSHADDEEYVYNHAKLYASAFNAAGITNERFCIKIPTTSAGVAAAKRLRAEGIATLGTALFSVPQALAAAQAGMHAISMYLNEPGAHSAAERWPDVADPAVEAPMANRHMQIRAAYDARRARGEHAPQMKTASYLSAAEALASTDLGADHITIGAPILTDLASSATLPPYARGMWKVPFADRGDRESWAAWAPGKPSDARMQALLGSDPVSGEGWAPADEQLDYTAAGVLDGFNERDEATRTRLEAALARFSDQETESRKFLQGLMAA
ncbi:hypothetical protein Q8F55_007838 [Vanrija albida]|uniref:Transaldolase n=1 Tax=Vanrija albida TaxID=181172 RepID=A0ABR3PUL5_9TREE